MNEHSLVNFMRKLFVSKIRLQLPLSFSASFCLSNHLLQEKLHLLLVVADPWFVWIKYFTDPWFLCSNVLRIYPWFSTQTFKVSTLSPSTSCTRSWSTESSILSIPEHSLFHPKDNEKDLELTYSWLSVLLTLRIDLHRLVCHSQSLFQIALNKSCKWQVWLFPQKIWNVGIVFFSPSSFSGTLSVVCFAPAPPLVPLATWINNFWAGTIS